MGMCFPAFSHGILRFNSTHAVSQTLCIIVRKSKVSVPMLNNGFGLLESVHLHANTHSHSCEDGGFELVTILCSRSHAYCGCFLCCATHLNAETATEAPM